MITTEDQPQGSKRGLFFGLALYLAFPVVAVTQYNAPPVWLLSNLFFALSIFWWCTRTQRSNAGLNRLLPAALCVLWMLLTIMLAAAWFSRAGGFDDAFFFHFNVPAALTSFEVYPLQSTFAALALVLSFLWPFFLSPRASEKRHPGALAGAFLALALVTFSPLHSLISYQAERSQTDAETGVPDSALRVAEPAVGTSQAGKNIVLLYLEGLENAFFDAEVFGDLLPRLSALAPQAVRFSNIRQRKGTGWTIAGIVASQCGFPILTVHNQANNSTMASVERPFADQQCFADVLKELDYRTVFVGGADLRFAGKGNFLRTHGYDTLFGRQELAREIDDAAPRNEWGYFDDQIMDFALRKVTDLDAGEAPWLLTLLTVDTHFPRGAPSPSCSPYPGSEDPMSQAIYCSDQLLANFIEKLWTVTDREHTTLVLFSDHLAFRTTLESKVRAVPRRTLTFWIFDTDLNPGVIETPGNHYDVAPTVFEAAQLQSPARFGHGGSLLVPDPQGQARSPTRKGKKDSAPELMAGSPSAGETGLVFATQNRSISVGELTLTPNRFGFSFKTGMFLVLFDEQGHVQDTLFETDFQRLLESHSGRLVAGVSQLDENQPPVAFYGRVGIDPATGLRQLPLLNDVTVPATEFRELMQAR